ncbi:uncharacterized protein V1518DRAFT_417227 [Limtongia smithiae]|uniref:uncharacterized protein n=1 Tax=Limtongia smithiae TaxID=1125753 RepID=UPI0034CD8142
MKKALARLCPPPLVALSAPLSGLHEFYILLDEPHRVWVPGDSVSGTVVLDLPKPVRTSQIRLRLLGQLTIRNPLVKGASFRHILFHEEIVLWDPGDCADVIATPADASDLQLAPLSSPSAGSVVSDCDSVSVVPSQAQSIRTRVSRRARLLSSVRAVTSSSAPDKDPIAGKLPRGEHTFAFMFDLPTKGLMTSLEFEKGSILYTLTASHHRPGPFPPVTAQKIVPVQCPLDIADLPPPKPSMLSIEVKKKNKKRERGGTATAIVETPSVGCLRGDLIPVKITVRHVRELRTPTGVVVTFLRISRVCAQDLEPLSFRKDLVQMVMPLYIDGNTLTTTFTANVRIPTDIFPTIDEYPLVAFKYCLEVVLDLSGKAELPIIQNAVTKPDAPTNLADMQSRPCIDTEELKYTKGVVSLWTEIIVGTERSEPFPRRSIQQPLPVEQPATLPSVAITHAPAATLPSQPAIENLPEQLRICSPSDALASEMHTTVPQYTDTLPPANAVRYIARSFREDESEKERIRRLEEVLLPSQPPQEETAESSLHATVPTLAEIEGMEVLGITSELATPMVSVSATEAPESSDKLEQERVRLLKFASAPDAGTPSVPQPLDLQTEAVPHYSASAPARQQVDAYASEDDDSAANADTIESPLSADYVWSDAEEEGEWVPVYSANADEATISLGGYSAMHASSPDAPSVDSAQQLSRKVVAI